MPPSRVYKFIGATRPAWWPACVLVVLDTLALHQVEARAEQSSLKCTLPYQAPHMAARNAKLRGSICDAHPIFEPHAAMVPHP